MASWMSGRRRQQTVAATAMAETSMPAAETEKNSTVTLESLTELTQPVTQRYRQMLTLGALLTTAYPFVWHITAHKKFDDTIVILCLNHAVRLTCLTKYIFYYFTRI